jgi:hypothetical protein
MGSLEHVRFDRHKIFSRDDLEMVMGLISDCRMLKSLDGGTVFNKLFGLYDGYLYDDLLIISKDFLTDANYRDLEQLVTKIKNHK